MESSSAPVAATAEDYRVFKRHIPFLYDLFYSHCLEWPSLTVQWMPTKPEEREDCTVQKIVLGTHTTNGEPNHLLIAEVRDSSFSLSSHSLSSTGSHAK